MNRLMATTLASLVGLFLLINLSMFTISEKELGVLFRLGEIVKSDYAPGLHFKVPFYHTVAKFDARVQNMDAPPVRYQTSELKNVVVDAFAKWRINNVADYFVAVGAGDVNARLAQIVNDLSRAEFGRRTVKAVVSGDRTKIMSILQTKANEQAQAFGVEIVDVRIRRVDLPADVSNSVYDRMDAERTRVAKELRSQGAEAAERIRAEADKERTITLAKAFREAEEVRGQGDAIATKTYAEAYGQDEDFYRFYRSLQAYRKVLESGQDVMVLEPKGEFFKYFGGAKTP